MSSTQRLLRGKMWMRKLKHPGSPKLVAYPEASAGPTRELTEPPSRFRVSLASMVGL